MFAYADVLFYEPPSAGAKAEIERAGGKMFFDGRDEDGIKYRIEVYDDDGQVDVEEAIGALEATQSCEFSGWNYE